MTQQQQRLEVVAVDMPPPPPAAPPAQEAGSGGRGPRALRPLGRRSLTARIVMGVVGLLVVLVAAVGITTYLALRSFLVSRLDQQLSNVAQGNQGRIAGCIQYGVPRCQLNPPQGRYTAPQTEWVTLLQADGRSAVGTFQQSESLRLLRLTNEDAQSVVADPTIYRTVTTEDGSTLRVVGDTVTAPDGEQYIVLSGLSIDDVRQTMGHVLGLELLIGGAAIVLAIVATNYGVRLSLRGLRRVTDTAQDVAAELSPEGRGLDRRVPVTEEGTEVAQLADSMNTLLGAVEMQFAARIESEERMRQFLADASHELRTPLTSIRGYAELARMQRAAGERDEDNLSRIESEGTRMSRLVEDLLLLARGDASGVTHEPELIDVDGLVDDAVSGARAAFPDRPIDADLHETLQVVGDRDQLLRVVRNLVTNAAVHTEEGRPILVRARDESGGVLVQVVDGGPGLPPDQASRVFERFWRADKARSRARGGSGLGLAIVATIVRAHGGSVYFDSAVETGSTVSVWLPGVRPS